MKLYPFRLYILAFFLCITGLPGLQAQINFPAGSLFSYLKGSEASSLASDWMSPSFNDAAWSKGNAPFRYGDGMGGTFLSDMQGSYSTLYLRTTFNVTNFEKLGDILFTIDYDDGFALWINGKEVINEHAPANMAYNAFSTASHESGTPVTFLLNPAEVPLQEGENLIAVQCFNVDLQSSDLYFDMAIAAEEVLPAMMDTVELAFSHPAGFYNTPFNLTVSSPDPAGNIWYTLDGSNPQTSSSAYRTGTKAIIRVDPASTEGRALTPAFIVRTSVKKDGYHPSIPETKTFLFVEEVKKQAYPGGNWPQDYVNEQLIDLAVDPRVINDSRYRDQINDAFLDIPSVSVVTELENLFDPVSGIYANTWGRGQEWERASSVELLNPDGTAGFQVNAGLRIRGGYSRRPEVAKHSFRLLFRKKYGDGKLHFPLFGNEGVGEFDRVDLRTAQNSAWHEGSAQATFVREVFSRDTQKDMGHPYTRSRYYHLYLNGMYWGLYQTQERSEAFFAESYLGGQEEDYDVIKVTSDDGYYVEATDGNMDSWERIYELTKKGFSQNKDYFYLEGKDAQGKAVKGAEVLVDIDNLIDYMLVIFFTGNLDAPVSHFMQNKRANNFYAIFNRTDKSRGYQFFAHDSEISMQNLYENRVNIGSMGGSNQMDVAELNVFHPQWLHFKLSENEEYRSRFADRAFHHLSENGVLSPEKAIIAESARWGDTKTSYSLNKLDHWIPEINYLRNGYLPQRTGIVIDQLREANLYAFLSAPLIKTSGNTIQGDVHKFSSSIQITFEKDGASGTVYYTLDGEDPRTTGGSIANSAVKVTTGNATLDIAASSVVKARLYSNGQWSALREVAFLKENEDFSFLKVTELHYHPSDIINGNDTLFGKDYEFIEFKNTGSQAINLAGLQMSGAVSYFFPEKSILAPGDFFVITSKPSKFYEVYGVSASGNFQGNLSNSGELLVLKDTAGNIILHFVYDDKSPWPEAADGKNRSLVSTEHDPSGQPNNINYWKASHAKGGSPFKDDHEVLGFNDLVSGRDALQVFPNPTGKEINVHLSSRQGGVAGDFVATLFTVEGESVFRKTFRDKGKIDLEALRIRGGLYILKVSSGSSVITIKVVYVP